jgi:hypothetical protein
MDWRNFLADCWSLSFAQSDTNAPAGLSIYFRATSGFPKSGKPKLKALKGDLYLKPQINTGNSFFDLLTMA